MMDVILNNLVASFLHVKCPADLFQWLSPKNVQYQQRHTHFDSADLYQICFQGIFN